MRYYRITYQLKSALCKRVVAIPLRDLFSDDLGPQQAVSVFLKHVSFARYAYIVSVKELAS